MTPRLRELEAAAANTPTHWTGHKDHARVYGYKMALEDLKPVLDAAKEILPQIDEVIYSGQRDARIPAYHILRDALPAMEAQDGD